MSSLVWSYAASQSPSHKPRPLVVFLSWMFAPPSVAAKYTQLINSLGWDCAFYQPNAASMWVPLWSAANSRKVLDEVERALSVHGVRPLVFAAFSGAPKAAYADMLSAMGPVLTPEAAAGAAAGTPVPSPSVMPVLPSDEPALGLVSTPPEPPSFLPSQLLPPAVPAADAVGVLSALPAADAVDVLSTVPAASSADVPSAPQEEQAQLEVQVTAQLQHSPNPRLHSQRSPTPQHQKQQSQRHSPEQQQHGQHSPEQQQQQQQQQLHDRGKVKGLSGAKAAQALWALAVLLEQPPSPRQARQHRHHQRMFEQQLQAQHRQCNQQQPGLHEHDSDAAQMHDHAQEAQPPAAPSPTHARAVRAWLQLLLPALEAEPPTLMGPTSMVTLLWSLATLAPLLAAQQHEAAATPAGGDGWRASMPAQVEAPAQQQANPATQAPQQQADQGKPFLAPVMERPAAAEGTVPLPPLTQHAAVVAHGTEAEAGAPSTRLTADTQARVVDLLHVLLPACARTLHATSPHMVVMALWSAARLLPVLPAAKLAPQQPTHGHESKDSSSSSSSKAFGAAALCPGRAAMSLDLTSPARALPTKLARVQKGVAAAAAAAAA
uniref:Uncharacterized protein n=1 Tax=Dunaliella tertiolecta TaxID=3047 RepID=A0A7S3QN32_DUNTE